LKLLDAGRQRDDRRALGIAHLMLSMIDLFNGNHHEALSSANDGIRSAVTPLERRMSATVRASARILLGHVHEGLVDLLEATGSASETGHGQMVAFGTIFVGMGYVLAGRINEGIQLLESAITTYDARAEDLIATYTKNSLAEIYLEMLTSRARPPLSVILKNAAMILRVKLMGMRRIEVLLDQAARNPHLDERGVTRARINMNMGLLHKLKKEPDRARHYLEKARAPAEHHGATFLLSKIDAALSELQ
jgi:hypothetical protein